LRLDVHVAPKMAQVALGLLALRLHDVLVGARSAWPLDLEPLVRIGRIRNWRGHGRRRQLGQAGGRRRLLREGRAGECYHGYQGLPEPIKFVTFLPKYVTKKDSLWKEVEGPEFARGCYRARVQAKTVAWLFARPQEEHFEHAVAVLEHAVFAEEVIDGMPILPGR